MTIEALGGYRVIRKLGEGARAEVFLAHPEDPAEPPVAIKAYRSEAADSAFVEIEALHRAAGAHVMHLLDVAPDAHGMPALVLERLPSGSLARLLRHRDRFAAGEAITILAPLAGALARLHDAGVLHGGLGEHAVLFGASGAPVLACFGRARVVAAGMSAAAREAERGFAADLHQFASLASGVLERVGDGGAVRMLEPQGTLHDFADRLFGLGEPSAVRFEGADERAVVPARLVRGEPIADAPPVTSAAFGIPEWVEGLLPRELMPTLARVRTTITTVRRPVWIAAGGGAVALVVALVLVLVPSGTGTDATPVPSPTPTTAVGDPGPVVGDDPVAAAGELLAARERCIRDLSVLCLDAVDQLGSAALADDQALIRSLQAGAELSGRVEIDPAAATLIERLGDSAIVGLGPETEPASLLLMKGEAGWRIREYLS